MIPPFFLKVAFSLCLNFLNKVSKKGVLKTLDPYLTHICPESCLFNTIVKRFTYDINHNLDDSKAIPLCCCNRYTKIKIIIPLYYTLYYTHLTLYTIYTILYLYRTTLNPYTIPILYTIHTLYYTI